jgi:hypothetical protein
MGVSSGRFRVADLSFQVFGRALHPDWFAVKAHRRITQTGWEADVRIVEGGHAITWGSGDVRLTEVLAGEEAALPELGLLYHARVRHERSVELRPGTRAEYQTCFEVERLDAELFTHLNDELLLEPVRGGLFHRFSPANRLAASPLSLVHIESRARGLSIQAFHTFPDERAIVRAQSLFEICDARRRP